MLNKYGRKLAIMASYKEDKEAYNSMTIENYIEQHRNVNFERPKKVDFDKQGKEIA